MAEMRLIGSKLTKIKAQRKRNFEGKISLKTGINIGNIERVKNQKDTVEVEYNFNINYGELGSIEIGGLLYIQGDSKTLKELQKSQKERDMESKEFLAVTNVILQKASVKAFMLEDELGLPAHVRLPTISPSND